MASAFGLRPAITAGGLLCTGAVALCTALMPGFTRYDERTGPHRRAGEPQAAAPV